LTILANKYRPKLFEDVVGQSDEVELLKMMVTDSWEPFAILFEGPFGTGKTTLARLLSRALLCQERTNYEPCGICVSCSAFNNDNNLGYTEVDAASQGLVDNIRHLKDLLSYQVSGTRLRILCLDESHMLSTAAQNALLQTLEEGATNTLFMFCTTEAHKMLPTIKSRCVVVKLRTLTVVEIARRLEEVCGKEGMEYEEKALRVIGSYARGHMRDAMVLLEQIHRVAGAVTEKDSRAYLRLDKRVDVYKFLCIEDKAEVLAKLEVLLCEYATKELLEVIGEVLVDAYKVEQGVTTAFAQVDVGWLKKVATQHKGTLLRKAERVLTAESDVTTIAYAVSVIGQALFEGEEGSVIRMVGKQPEEHPDKMPQPPSRFRKPGKDLPTHGGAL